MPRPKGPDLTKVTLNLESADVLTLKARYGYGYTEQIRRIVHENCAEYRKHRRSIQDLIAEEVVDDHE